MAEKLGSIGQVPRNKPKVHPSMHSHTPGYAEGSRSRDDPDRPRRGPPPAIYAYTPEIADRVCELLSQGMSIDAVGALPDMPSRWTIKQWIAGNEHGFQTQYARAKQSMALSMADELLEIADNPEPTMRRELKSDGSWKEITWDGVDRSKVRIHTRMWMLARLMPAIYGDVNRVELAGPDGTPIEMTETERAAKIAAILIAAQKELEAEQNPQNKPKKQKSTKTTT